MVLILVLVVFLVWIMWIERKLFVAFKDFIY